MILLFVASALISLILGRYVISYLKKLKYGQEIRKEGPQSHLQKAGTPTMGGIFFIISFLCVSIFAMIYFKLDIKISLFVLLMPLLYALLGFIDDYNKIIKHDNLGLNAKQKLLLQIAFATAIILIVKYVLKIDTVIKLPFIKGKFDLGFLYYPLVLIMITGATNAVNLTDGLDGLCGGVSLIVLVGTALIAKKAGVLELSYMSIALAGALLGFLYYNFYPAKVFMGDTGSLFLGGFLAVAFIVLKMPLHLIFIGIFYVIETLSVILQVLYFKSTGKRLFLMSPIHHHFEMKGYSENTIVLTSYLINIIVVFIVYMWS
ncbi:MAG: phospho-N-acetylmuramoyl-pentapeptide-transferase [Firmicutes bacterium]|nr:phospho-N-acetylmuramoyl-pentapeptide-transferase [Bacillota bacterium]